MKLKFLKDVELTVVNSFNIETEKVEETQEKFSKDEVVDVDYFENYAKSMDIKFGDGSIVYGLEKKLFVIEE
jgi:hypothetical protein